MMQFVEETLASMNDLVPKFPKFDDLALDANAMMLLVAECCTLLDNNRQFVGCEKKSGCAEKSTAGLAKVFARQLQNNMSDFRRPAAIEGTYCTWDV